MSRRLGTLVLAASLVGSAVTGQVVVTAPNADARIELPPGEGRVLRLVAPMASVFIANPEVADIQIRSPAMLYLTALSSGETTLFAVDAEDRVLVATTIIVRDRIRIFRGDAAANVE